MIQVDLSRHKPVVVVTDVQELFTAADGPFENTSSVMVFVAQRTV